MSTGLSRCSSHLQEGGSTLEKQPLGKKSVQGSWVSWNIHKNRQRQSGITKKHQELVLKMAWDTNPARPKWDGLQWLQHPAHLWKLIPPVFTSYSDIYSTYSNTSYMLWSLVFSGPNCSSSAGRRQALPFRNFRRKIGVAERTARFKRDWLW